MEYKKAKSTSRRLVLNRTTLKQLSDQELEQAAGGNPTRNCHTQAFALCEGPPGGPTKRCTETVGCA